MTSAFVVLGLIVVVILVVVLVALGMRASRQARDDDEWVEEGPRPRGRRAAGGNDRRVAGAPLSAPTPVAPATDGYEQGYDQGYDSGQGYDAGYDQGYDQPGYDQPGYDQGYGTTEQEWSQQPAPAKPLSARRGRGASEEMEDDDYWATITFDKPKFPWQHEGGQRPPGDDPLQGMGDEGHEGAPVPGRGREPVDVPVAGFAADGDPMVTGPDANRSDAYEYDQGYDQPGYEQSQGYDQPGYDQPGYEQGQGYDQPGYEQTPAYDQGQGYDQPGYEQPGYEQPGYDQPGYEQTPAYDQGYDRSGFGNDPLGVPVARDRPSAGDTQFFQVNEPEPAAPPHPSSMATQNFSVGSMGGASGAVRSPQPPAAGPLQPPAAPPMPPAAPVSLPATPAAAAPSLSDSDSQRLPTVDELLQKIQTDRKRSGETPAAYGRTPDPLSDPLPTTAGTPSWSSAASAFEQDPLGTGGYPAAPATSGGYPAAPAYGGEPRYEDPLTSGGFSTGGAGGGGNGAQPDSYGSYGGQNDTGHGYGDFSGSSYSGGPDPLNTQRGYPETPAGGGYNGGYTSGGYPADPAYGTNQEYGAANQEYGGDQGYRSGYGQEQQQQPDDWDTYRGPRR